mgnify:CR=1 FL=1
MSDICPTEGDGMVFRRSADADDEVTNTLIDRGVYRLSEVYEDEEIKKFRDLQVPYSFWSAVKYSFILTVLLWWLPVFGQMVAGFVGGRRAGKPWKGVLAALVPLTMIFIVSLLVENGTIPTVIMGFDWTPSRLLVRIEEAVPLLAPYIVFVDMYMTSFIDTIQISTNMRMDVYIITAAFAYIGGILAEPLDVRARAQQTLLLAGPEGGRVVLVRHIRLVLYRNGVDGNAFRGIFFDVPGQVECPDIIIFRL